MKRLCVGFSKATMIDDGGNIHTAVKRENAWISEGVAYDNPFKAFMEGELNDGLSERKSDSN